MIKFLNNKLLWTVLYFLQQKVEEILNLAICAGKALWNGIKNIIPSIKDKRDDIEMMAGMFIICMVVLILIPVGIWEGLRHWTSLLARFNKGLEPIFVCTFDLIMLIVCIMLFSIKPIIIENWERASKRASKKVNKLNKRAKMQ